MVSVPWHAPLAILLHLADATKTPVFERLDPPRRAAVVMALLAFTLIGLFLVAAVMIGARWVRRLARHNRGPTTQNTNSENRQLRAALEPILPEGDTGETTIAKKSSNDTIAGP